MGLKSLFGSKKLIDRLIKYCNEKNMIINQEDNKYIFELLLSESGYMLYPYFILDEEKEELSMVINIRKSEKSLTVDDYSKINSFNNKSKYFSARVSEENIIYIEYSALVNADNIKDVFKTLIENIFSLQEDIDAL